MQAPTPNSPATLPALAYPAPVPLQTPIRSPDAAAPLARMDRETRLFAESHFRGLRGRLPGGVCPTLDCVDFIENPDSFSYADFFKGYLLPNVPCVFSSAFTETWGSRRHWVTPSGKPNFDYLLRNYGECRLPKSPPRARQASGRKGRSGPRGTHSERPGGARGQTGPAGGSGWRSQKSV